MTPRLMRSTKRAGVRKGTSCSKSSRGKVKMVQVHESTHNRLAALKVPGLTMEDVINPGLDKLSPEDIAKHYAAWQADAMAKLSKVSTPIRPASVAAKA